MSRVAMAFKARTGRAVRLMLAADARGPHVIERSLVPLLPEGEFAPYHAAAQLEPAAAREHVTRSIATARRLAIEALRGAAKKCADEGHELCGCAVLVGPGMPGLDHRRDPRGSMSACTRRKASCSARCSSPAHEAAAFR
jgi:hypothetical protein